MMNTIKKTLLYCGLTREEYEGISPLINERNYSLITIISSGMAVFGLVFVISWMFGAATVLYPYLMLVFCGIISFLVAKYVMKKAGKFTLPFCYLQISIIFVFATILSSMDYNRENPSTSIIVFLALLPVTINDRPVRMFGVVALFSAIYLVCSSYVKMPEAHHADVMNTLTFSSVGMLVYILVSNRNVHEIFLRQKAAESDRLREEKAAADMANAAKTDFLANMSHEIRTPINAIMGMNEIILRDSRSGMENGGPASETFRSIHGSAGIISSAGHSLISIINSILDFSKIESGKTELTESNYDLNTLLNDVGVMIALKANGKGLQFRLNVDKALPSAYFGDEVRVRQILSNLLTNAVKYTDAGSVELTVGMEEGGRAENGQMLTLVFAVTDTGIGIREEDMKRLFYRFERMDMRRNSTVEGTGLGLAITKSLLNIMNGSITAESVYGKGSTFTVRLPQLVVSAEPVGYFRLRHDNSAQEGQLYRESFHAPDCRILVVDDTRMNITVVERLLQHTGLQIDSAESGMEAVELCCRSRYDLVLMDQRMPHMDGIEAQRRIRETEDSLNADTPFICLTADAVMGARERYLAEGFAEYLSKPVNSQALEKMLMKYLPAKKVTVIQDAPRPQASSDVPEAFAPLQAAGISVQTGLHYAQDDPEFYRSILKEYGQSAAERQDRMAQALAAENWKDYGIYAHALKGTSRGIGADSLADSAERLEAAARENDGNTIRKKHPELMALYRQVLSAVGAVVSLEDENGGEDEILEFIPEEKA